MSVALDTGSCNRKFPAGYTARSHRWKARNGARAATLSPPCSVLLGSHTARSGARFQPAVGRGSSGSSLGSRALRWALDPGGWGALVQRRTTRPITRSKQLVEHGSPTGAYSGQSGHPFRFNSASGSDSIRPRSPGHSGQGRYASSCRCARRAGSVVRTTGKRPAAPNSSDPSTSRDSNVVRVFVLFHTNASAAFHSLRYQLDGRAEW